MHIRQDLNRRGDTPRRYEVTALPDRLSTPNEHFESTRVRLKNQTRYVYYNGSRSCLFLFHFWNQHRILRKYATFGKLKIMKRSVFCWWWKFEFAILTDSSFLNFRSVVKIQGEWTLLQDPAEETSPDVVWGQAIRGDNILEQRNLLMSFDDKPFEPIIILALTLPTR